MSEAHEAMLIANLMMLALSISASLFCYWYGGLVERVKWNKLIDKGLIPKPKSRG